MNNKVYNNRTVSEIVREDYRTADVFKRYGINYCCGGKITINEACLQRNVELNAIVADLEYATLNIQLSNYIDYNSWSIDFLIDYILNIHHAYLYLSLPVLHGSILSFVDSHKKNYPDFVELLEIFENLSDLLIKYNKREEEVIFPYIRQISNTFRRKESYGSLFVKTLRKPLSSVTDELVQIEEHLVRIRSLTNNYQFPDSACTNHQVIFGRLKEFDNDLVHHKHLENNILYPRAIELEKQLLLL
jgi:regulator of cell morphogenesis and NO signaling